MKETLAIIGAVALIILFSIAAYYDGQYEIKRKIAQDRTLVIDDSLFKCKMQEIV